MNSRSATLPARKPVPRPRSRSASTSITFPGHMKSNRLVRQLSDRPRPAPRRQLGTEVYEEYDCSHIYEDIDQVIQQAEIQNESVIPKPETEPRYVPLPLRFSHSSRNKTIERVKPRRSFPDPEPKESFESQKNLSFRELVSEKLKALKENLQLNSEELQTRLISDIVSIRPRSLTDACDVVCSDVISFVETLEVNHYQTSLKLIDWALSLSNSISDLNSRLITVKECAQACRNVVFAMYTNNFSSEIEKQAIPLMRGLSKEVEKVQTIHRHLKAEIQAYCACYLACCYGYINRHSDSLEISKYALLIMYSAYGVEGRTRRVMALCYQIRAEANARTQNYDDAIRDYEQEIRMLESAEDLTTDDRSQCIDNTLRSLQNIRENRVALK
ncbi:uncharacterized protein LOC143449273 isoform X2 [Clavelina lepadiformis]|uniref:uncharacterized protein LOC143449273 isoform X2 n=1 Tax=Clavelina lepadiformis TaxID=159417 RepID=UPI004042A0B9